MSMLRNRITLGAFAMVMFTVGLFAGSIIVGSMRSAEAQAHYSGFHPRSYSYQYVTNSVVTTSSGAGTIEAYCPSGYSAVGGGYLDSDLNITSSKVYGSHFNVSTQKSWVVNYYAPTYSGITFTAYVICG
jgi:hypothetical protein